MMEIEDTVNQAKQAFERGKFQDAVKGFETALQAYRSEGKEVEAAEMANNLSVVFLKQKKNQTALDIVLGTEKVFEQNNQLTKQAMAIGNKAAALEALKRYDEAEEAYNLSAELLKGSNEEELRGYVLQSLAALQMRRGKQLDSLFSMKSGLDGQEKLSLRKRFLRWMLKIPFRFLKS